MDSRNFAREEDRPANNERHRSRSNQGYKSDSREKIAKKPYGKDQSREASPPREYGGPSNAYPKYDSMKQYDNQRDRGDRHDYNRGGGGQFGNGAKKDTGYNNGSSYVPMNKSTNHYGPPAGGGGYGGQSYQNYGQGNSFESQHEPIKKDFYVEHDITKNRSEEENIRFMTENNISTTGMTVPRPVQQFDESNLPKYLVDQLKSTPKFVAPSPIQSQSWPAALSGRDVIGIAQTGSGKTLAFTIPAIVHVMAQPVLKRGDGPIVLVMAPTRELVMQIEVETRRYANVCQLTSLAVYGGAPRGDQQRKLRNGVEILIATPGRLIDFIESRDTNMRRITYLVLDEADRMLDMGFEKDIRKILSHITHPDRQTTMFSATWPPEIQQLAQNFCTTAPIQIRIGNQTDNDGGLTLNSDITQNVHILDSNYEKYSTLVDLMSKMMENEIQHKIIIFCQTKVGVDDLERSLRNDVKLTDKIKFEVRGIHGDKQQKERDYTLNMFKRPLEGFRCSNFIDQTPVLKSNILVATDVASRGLDVKDISIVINYDMPTCIEDYVHRIGRTGRAGKKGISHCFLTKKELGLVNDLVKILKKTNQYIDPQLYDLKKLSYNCKQENKYRKWRKPGEGGGYPFNNRGGGAPRFSRGGDDDRYQKRDGPGGYQRGGSRGDFGNRPQFGDRFSNQRGHGYQPQSSGQRYNNDGGDRQRDYGNDNQSYLNDISKQRFTQQDLKNELFSSAPVGITSSNHGGPRPMENNNS